MASAADSLVGKLQVGEYLFTDGAGASVRVSVKLDLAKVREATAAAAQRARRSVDRRASMAHGALVVDIVYDSKPPPVR